MAWVTTSLNLQEKLCWKWSNEGNDCDRFVKLSALQL